jgi:hypothetical protein
MDTTGFLLEHLPAVLDEDFFIKEVYEKQRALDMVTSQISNKVMSNSNAFSRNLEQFFLFPQSASHDANSRLGD